MTSIFRELKSILTKFLIEQTKSIAQQSTSQSHTPFFQLAPTSQFDDLSQGSVQSIRPSVPLSRPQTLSNSISSPSLSLWKAVQLNQIQICKQLLKQAQKKDSQINPNMKHGTYKRTALHIASLQGQYQICQILLDYTSYLKVDPSDIYLSTPLHLACKEGHLKIVQLLVRSGADLNKKNMDFDTPLHLACSNDWEAIVKWILTKTPDISIKNAQGQTPEDCCSDCIKELFKGFANKHRRRIASPVKNNQVSNQRQSEPVFQIDSVSSELSNTPRRSAYTLDFKWIQEEVQADNFALIKKIGQGSFGKVYLVRQKSSQKFFAMKILKKQEVGKKNLIRYVMAERSILLHSSHPFIVSLYCSFQTSQKLFLVMNYCAGGNLGELIQSRSRLSELEAKVYICEVLLAIQYLHHRNIIFRDLKPQNIVLDQEGHAMLADFGLSKQGVYDNTSAHSFCGSIAYLPPQIVRRRGHGKAVDWYLLGGLLYEMLVGTPPYYSRNQDELIRNIQMSQLSIPNSVSFQARSLIQELLERDQEKRLGSNGDAKEVKRHPYFRDIDWKAVARRELTPIRPLIKEPVQENINPQEVFGSQQSDVATLVRGWSFVSENY